MDKTLDTKKHLKLPHVNMAKYKSLIGQDPHIDWVIVFVVSIIIGAGLIWWGISRFTTVRSIEYSDTGSTPEDTTNILRPEHFINISKEFEARRLKTAEVQKDQVYTPDPSVL